MQNNLTSRNSECSVCKDEKGFSLIELVIAMIVFLIVTASIYSVLQVAGRSRTLVNQQAQLNKNVRIALSLIGRDTYNAGFGYPLKNTVVLPDNRISVLLAIPNDTDSSRDTVPPIIAGDDLTLNTFNSASNVKTDQITFLFKDSTFNLVGEVGKEVSLPININAATTSATGIDEVVTISGSNAGCRKNDLFLVTGNTGSALGVVTGLINPGSTSSDPDKVQFSNGDVLGFNQTGTSGPLRGITAPASMQRVRMVTYFVTADGILTRREYVNVPPIGTATPKNYVDEPIVYGVENFQIRYILDDGSISDNPSAGADGKSGTSDDVQANLAKIRQVRYTIFVKGSELNPAGKPYTVNMTSTFSTRNLGYDAN